MSVVSQFMHAPRVPHWDAVVRILRYLNGFPLPSVEIFHNLDEVFCINRMVRIESFSDADWAPSDRKSKTWYCTFVGGKLHGKSKKQSVVARSSAEAEYRAYIGLILRVN